MIATVKTKKSAVVVVDKCDSYDPKRIPLLGLCIFFGRTFVQIKFRFYAATGEAVIIDTKMRNISQLRPVESPFVKFVNYLVSKNAVHALFIQEYAWPLSFLAHFLPPRLTIIYRMYIYYKA
jgi:hypothetical protein